MDRQVTIKNKLGLHARPAMAFVDVATQFQAAIKGLEIGQRTIDIARGVLVEGRPQADFVNSLGLTKGAVSQAVSRVWAAAGEILPKGFERVTAVLPEYQAFIVKKWEADAKRKQEPKP